ncbi:MAG: enoyl-CoA hydratase-related protein [Acidimicrobiales bacterium]|jgi:methylglutaconyl-CoA hydratase
MPLVEADLRNGVMTITLADEEHRNALGRQLTGELVAALDRADHDPEVRVVVLTNSGSVFCAGANLAERAADPSAADPNAADPSAASTSDAADTQVSSVNPLALFRRFRHSPKPYVGRIAGHCVAGGVGLAAALDISIAADHARFGFTEVRVGVAPAMISVICLPKMRLADARAAFLRGHRFPAAEAVRMGLLNGAVPADQLDAEIDAIVSDLLAGEPNAIAASKQLIDVVPTLPEDDAFRWTAELSARLFASDEAREGMTAFLEKRPASWVR